MGYLTVTSVTNASSPAGTGTIHTQPSHAPSTVCAEITIHTTLYRYVLSGVPYRCLGDIPALVPYLQEMLREQRYKPEQHTDTDYGIARQLTFSAPGYSSHSEVIASSARALKNLLDEVVKNKSSGIKVLRVNDKAQTYIKGREARIFKPALEALPKTFSKIQPQHFSALTILEIGIIYNSGPVIDGFTNLLERNGLRQLKTLDLQFAGNCFFVADEGGDIQTYGSERAALYKFYRNGLLDALSTPPLEHLHLPFWCAQGTELGLAILRKLYPGLKTLTIDMVIPTAVITTAPPKRSHPSKSSAKDTAASGESALYFRALRIPKPEVIAEQPTLLTLLEEMQEVSQLECLEIYDWPVGKNFVAEYSLLQTAIENGWLPKLNSIAIRFNITARYQYLLETTIDSKTATDVSSLLEVVVNAKVPVRKLQLIMPEKTGYQNWLEEMAKGSFPKLVQLHYRLPDRWLGEEYPDYYARVEKALETIHTAVQEGQLPQLEVFIVEGNQAVQTRFAIQDPPPKLLAMVQDIEEAVLAQKTSTVTVKPSTEQPLVMSASSRVTNIVEINQEA
jgi:hypothetical protein